MDEDQKEYSFGWWKKEIEQAEKKLDEEWRLGADKVVKRFLDIRENMEDGSRMNIFWANVGILKAALYATPPRPMVTRQFGDYGDDVARVASTMLERLLQIDLSKDRSEAHKAYKLCIDDRLLPGLGQVWHRYEPEIVDDMTEEIRDPMTGQIIVPSQPYKRIASEKATTDYVQWRDFLWPAARTWEEVWWVGRRVWMRKDRFIKRFGQTKYDEHEKVDQDARPKDSVPKHFTKNKIETFEIWCKTTKKVHWLTKNVMLEEKDDPLKLTEFFPCPEPLLATHTTNSLIPRPDYVMVQDKYNELDTLNTRCTLLEKALRVVGVYDKNSPEVASILKDLAENNMIAAENFAGLAEKGGLKGVVDWFPVEVIAAALDKLRELKREKVQEIYELTGLSDIMRGATSPRETAAAQKIKAQYSSVRLQYAQQEVGVFVTASLRIRAEIIVRHFQPENIIRSSLIQNTDDAPLAQQAVELLKNVEMSDLKIDVNEESLALPDYNQERDTRIEYITAVGQFISQIWPLIQAEPEAAPTFAKMLQWVTSGFRGSKEIEGVLDAAITEMMKPKPPKLNPDMEKAKMEAGLKAAELKSKEKIEQDKLKSNERLKMMEIFTNQKSDQQEMTLDFLKERMLMLSDNLNQSHDRQLQRDQAEADRQAAMEQTEEEMNAETNQALLQVAETSAETNKLLQQLIMVLAKPKVRKPVRGKDGEISHVIETVGE